MKIINHLLCNDDGSTLDFRLSPNRGGVFEKNALKFLVLHYTAGRSADSAAHWLCNPDAKASAHLIIGKDGKIIQLVPFNTIAWHAGKSQWAEPVQGGTAAQIYDGLNRYSIGIELDNPGRLVRQGDQWRSLSLGTSYPLAEGIELTHKHESKPAGWHLYPAAQLEAAFAVAHLLVQTYGLLDVLGHDDIAKNRKSDPGPAFPMDSFRSKLFGRMDAV